ncbi:MAG: MaoC family dehydratase [Caldimonas sp.]|nr:MaoC family dehydratase [Pseudomonadota bacterium]
MSGDPVVNRDETVPTRVGETFLYRVRLREEEIPAFAASVFDFNPLHHDTAFASAAGYPGLIASGTQIGSMLMALTATHFSKPLEDGRPRNGLGMGFELRFRAVVFANEDIELRWTVTSVERKARLAGWIVQLEGDASSSRGVLLGATGTLLLRLGEPKEAST